MEGERELRLFVLKNGRILMKDIFSIRKGNISIMSMLEEVRKKGTDSPVKEIIGENVPNLEK